MEGLAWLLIKMASLLALTGAAFLALGWWLRGRQAPACDPVAANGEGAATELEEVRAALRAATEGRDLLEGELTLVRSRLAAAEEELQRLRAVPASVPEAQTEAAAPADLDLQPPSEKKPKSRAPRKPRAKKKA